MNDNTIFPLSILRHGHGAKSRSGIMLYSLCMKFQAELVNFQDQLENRVLCKTFSSRQNSEVHSSVTTHEELKNVFE